MNKVVKLIISAFVGLDIFVFSYLGLAQLRVNLFGEGAIPGGGSAMDMALFLIPLFLGYVAGDRLYYFLTYKERREKALQRQAEQHTAGKAVLVNPEVDAASIWEDSGWTEGDQAVKTGRKQE